MVPNEVEDQVVPLVSFGEIFFGVVNDVICADLSDNIDIARTTYASHLGAE